MPSWEGRLRQRLAAAGWLQPPPSSLPPPAMRGSSSWAAPQALRVPWQPVLSHRQLRRGLTYYGSGDRLRQVAAKLLAGQPLMAVTLGGSVTRGAGAAPDASFPQRFFQALNASFPHRWGGGWLVVCLGGCSLHWRHRPPPTRLKCCH